MLHKDITVGEECSHPPGYVQATDPGAVGAHRVWVDTSGGTGAYVWKIRKADDSGWEELAAVSPALASSTVSGTVKTDADEADPLVYLAATIDTMLANMAETNQAQTWTKPQRGAFVTLTSAANLIATDLSLSDNFKITLGENNTLSAPTNAVEGQSGVIVFTQDGTGSRTMAYDSFWDFTGSAPALSTAAGAVDVLSYFVLPGATRARVQLSKET